jgi:DNA mismatch repair protein MutS
MLDQYRRIKGAHRGEVLFFRLGDFYEMFFDDALEVSSLLNLTLTSRNGFPMCGIPYHAVRSYIARLLKFGKKIAICEQLSEPGKGRGIVERDVVEVITPGTTVDEDYLEKGSSNYLGALTAGTGGGTGGKAAGGSVSFAYIDLSTGDFYATSFAVPEAPEKFRQELERLQIKELVVQESLVEEQGGLAAALFERPSLVINRWADWLFDPVRSRERLEKQFGTVNLKGFGLDERGPEIIAAGALLDYLDDTAKSLIPHVRSVVLYGDDEFVGIDESSQRNLELIRNLRDMEGKFSLLAIMDETRTAMGRRLLKWRILHPLRNLDAVNKRLDMVESLYRDQGRLTALRDILGKTPDLERLCSRLAMDRAHGKDMYSIKNALTACRSIKDIREGLAVSYETASPPDGESFSRLAELRNLLEQGLCEDPSTLLTEGNLIRDGFDAGLDELRSLRDNGRQLLENYLKKERDATGIPSLKIRYNRVIGYFFEVTKVHLSKVPAHFIRRQGIVAGERFTTDRLAALESDINGASDRIIDLEKELFLEIRNKAKGLIPELSSLARCVAELDTAQSLAWAATVRGWVRPRLDEGIHLHITEGRHPVVEAHLARGEFIPNDCVLEREGVSFALITGPNMAGKSTYLRQVALIALMAQAGSFVPALEASIGMVDRIYCRVGASDNLARGESTFLVEMNETAHILRTATEKSLVIMDEVGRGTGTVDGLSIAWAVSGELLEYVKCRTLFATHYHELSMISHPRIVNRSMEVLDRDGEIVFLRKLKEGPSAESYGLHVARLAGLPERVLAQAAQIMDRLKEREKLLNENLPVPAAPATAALAAGDGKTAVPPEDERIKRFIADLTILDPNRMTPLEALNRIAAWKQLFAAKPEGIRKPRQEPPFLFDLY